MIQVSRTDIVSDSLMKFDERRFIKLPIDGYMDLLGITPNTSQHAIINAINNPKYRFVTAAVSRRQGVTKCFQINPKDNTAVLLEDGGAAEEIEIVGAEGMIVLQQDIEYGHKVALVDIPPGEAVVKYGICIGHSTQPIRAGEWIHLHNCASDYDQRSATLDVHSGAVTDTVYE